MSLLEVLVSLVGSLVGGPLAAAVSPAALAGVGAGAAVLVGGAAAWIVRRVHVHARRRERPSPAGTAGPPSTPPGSAGEVVLRPAEPTGVASQGAGMASPAPATAEREVAFEDRRAGQPEAPLEVRPRRTEDLTKTLGAGLEATRRPLLAWIGGLRSGRVADDARFDELEEVLLRADVGLGPTEVLVSTVREAVRRGNAKGADEVVELLRNRIAELLRRPIDDVGGELRFDTGVVNVWLFVGVNGVGKTTTIAKVARRERLRGRSVLLAAADTFRAAAQEQLATWAERVGVDLVPGRVGGDPAAVVFDAVQRAAARGHDLVLADTAGRLHTKANLMEELKKVRRVAARKPGRVTEVLLVIDATTGQNGLVQARRFVEAVGVTGVVLTKLDGSAKGGIVVAIAEELGVPVKLVGLGEGIDDLADFDPTGFAEALVGGR